MQTYTSYGDKFELITIANLFLTFHFLFGQIYSYSKKIQSPEVNFYLTIYLHCH